MVFKRLTCPACRLHLGGYDERMGTVVLDVETHPTIAFFVDATDPSDATPSDAPRYNVRISCPSCGHSTPFEAVSIRFGKKQGKRNTRAMSHPRPDRRGD